VVLRFNRDPLDRALRKKRAGRRNELRPRSCPLFPADLGSAYWVNFCHSVAISIRRISNAKMAELSTSSKQDFAVLSFFSRLKNLRGHANAHWTAGFRFTAESRHRLFMRHALKPLLPGGRHTNGNKVSFF
jgi:hypothetical protein